MVDHQCAPIGVYCFARVCHLKVEVVVLGHSTAEATGSVGRHTIRIYDTASLGHVHRVILVCPLQRDHGCDRGRLELCWSEDNNIKLLLEPADPADGIFVTCKSAYHPAVCTVDHANAFQQEESQVVTASSNFTPQAGSHSTCFTGEIGDFFD